MEKNMKLVELYISWFKMGLFTFGGGYAMLPMIEKEIIEKHHWATEDEVMDYYAIGQCTPGVIAINTATFIGYKVDKVRGAIVSTLGVITPSLIIITLIAGLLNNFQDIPMVQHGLAGIRIGVCVLMSITIYKLIKKNVTNKLAYLIVITSFILAYYTNVSMVILVLLYGFIGFVTSYRSLR
jgi:chromate transporter